jgi:hypothetical protein
MLDAGNVSGQISVKHIIYKIRNNLMCEFERASI